MGARGNVLFLTLLTGLCLSLTACIPYPLHSQQQKQLAHAQLKAQLQAAEPQLKAAGVADRPLDVQMRGPTLLPETDSTPYERLPQILLEDGPSREPLRVACKAGYDGQVVCRRLQPSTTDYLRQNGSTPRLAPQ